MTQLPSVMELMVSNSNRDSHYQSMSQINQQSNQNKSTAGPVVLPPLSKHLSEPTGDNYSLNKRISISSSINANSRNSSASNESTTNSVVTHPLTLSNNVKAHVVRLGSPIDNNVASQNKSNSLSNIPTVSSNDENSNIQTTSIVKLKKSPSISPKQGSGVSPQGIKSGNSPKAVSGPDYFQYQSGNQQYPHPPYSTQYHPQAQYYPHPQMAPGGATSGQHIKAYFDYAGFNPAVHYASQLTPGLTPGLSPSVNAYPYGAHGAPNVNHVPVHQSLQQHQSLQHQSLQHQSLQQNQSLQQQNQSQQQNQPNPHQTPIQQHVSSPLLQAQVSPCQTAKRPSSIPLSPQNFIPTHYPVPPHMTSMTPGLTPGLTPGIPPQGMHQVMPLVMNAQHQGPYPHMPTNMTSHPMHGIPHQMSMVHGVPMMNVPPGGVPVSVGMNVPMWYEDNHALLHKRRIIKRRTRTGCLTCRKRRIKCDERKPYCFNCERSRKVCLGYENLNKKEEKGSDNDENDENDAGQDIVNDQENIQEDDTGSPDELGEETR